MPKFNVPFKAGHGLPHSTGFNWLRLLTNRRPSPSGVSNIERRGVSNPGSHYRESNVLPTELRDRQIYRNDKIAAFRGIKTELNMTL